MNRVARTAKRRLSMARALLYNIPCLKETTFVLDGLRTKGLGESASDEKVIFLPRAKARADEARRREPDCASRRGQARRSTGGRARSAGSSDRALPCER